ncbi:hypothetical protein H6769_05840 [Candidatus Peribacteria bacterium]|nr:hypothetical protein [Candidatus Peribacteria bacterium]
MKHREIDGVDLAILHPPYADIIKFSDQEGDLSNTKDAQHFLESFGKVIHNTYKILKKKGYIVIEDTYKELSLRWEF